MARLRLLSYMVPGYPLDLFEAIAETLGVELAVDSERSGPAPGDNPFHDGRADLAWLCSTSLAELRGRAGGDIVVPAGVGWVPIGEARGPVYFGDVVVVGSDARRSLESLEGARFGLNDEISLSGNLSLRFALRSRGIDPDGFGELDLTGGHRISLERLAEGRLDVAIVDSIVLAAAVAEDPALADLKVIERLGPWPVPPLVVRSELAERAPEFASKLLEPNDGGRLQRALNDARLARFAATTIDDYQPVFDAMALWA